MNSYTFTQSSPATTWVIAHNFDELPNCDVMSLVDGTIQKITPASMVHTDSNTLTLTFSIATSGEARVVGTRTTNTAFVRDLWLPPDGSPASSGAVTQNVSYPFYNFIQLVNNNGNLGVAYEESSTLPYYVGTSYGDSTIAQSNADSDNFLRVNNFNGSNTLGVGHQTIGTFGDIPPIVVGTTVSSSFEDNGAGPIYSPSYFALRTGDYLWITAQTANGENAGQLTVVVGPSATVGERYTLTFTGVTNSFPTTGTLSATRLTDIGGRTPAFI
jgi:hypothetical protein